MGPGGAHGDGDSSSQDNQTISPSRNLGPIPFDAQPRFIGWNGHSVFDTHRRLEDRIELGDIFQPPGTTFRNNINDLIFAR